jgi:hypothetical protein
MLTCADELAPLYEGCGFKPVAVPTRLSK